MIIRLMSNIGGAARVFLNGIFCPIGRTQASKFVLIPGIRGLAFGGSDEHAPRAYGIFRLSNSSISNSQT